MSRGRAIYLHIGTPKTGTTTLQYVCDGNRDLLKTDGVYYPRTPGERQHIKLVLYAFEAAGSAPARLAPLLRHSGISTPEQLVALQRTFPASLQDEVQESGCDTVILSSEFLSGRLTRPEELKRIGDLLRQLGHVKVVCYLRPQHEVFLSNDSAKIKAGSTERFPLPKTDQNFGFNYELLLNLWAGEFGDDNIVVRVFDSELLVGGDIVEDFFSVIDYQPSPELKRPRDLNQRLDADTTNFLLLLNRHLPPFVGQRRNPERGDVVEALEAIADGRKDPGDGNLMRRIMEMYAPSNAAVAKRFLGRSDGVLFPNIRIADAPTGDSLTAERAVEIAAYLWKWQGKQLRDAQRRIMELQRAAAPQEVISDSPGHERVPDRPSSGSRASEARIVDRGR
jgi:hypothetical protein